MDALLPFPSSIRNPNGDARWLLKVQVAPLTGTLYKFARALGIDDSDRRSQNDLSETVTAVANDPDLDQEIFESLNKIDWSQVNLSEVLVCLDAQRRRRRTTSPHGDDDDLSPVETFAKGVIVCSELLGEYLGEDDTDLWSLPPAPDADVTFDIMGIAILLWWYPLNHDKGTKPAAGALFAEALEIIRFYC